jgi:hypothetical protein
MVVVVVGPLAVVEVEAVLAGMSEPQLVVVVVV